MALWLAWLCVSRNFVIFFAPWLTWLAWLAWFQNFRIFCGTLINVIGVIMWFYLHCDEFWPNFKTILSKVTILTKFPILIKFHNWCDFDELSQFWPTLTILTNFLNFDQISYLTKFHSFDQISQFWPVLTKFHNFYQILQFFNKAFISIKGLFQ